MKKRLVVAAPTRRFSFNKQIDEQRSSQDMRQPRQLLITRSERIRKQAPRAPLREDWASPVAVKLPLVGLHLCNQRLVNLRCGCARSAAHAEHSQAGLG